MTTFEQQHDQERALLDRLLEDARLYHTGAEYQRLLDFVVSLRNVAPFNAMLLQIQKPGVEHVASAYDWRRRFGRGIREGARPLLIMWPFGPVATVYDVHDTTGAPLPEGIHWFPAKGEVDASAMLDVRKLLVAKNITCIDLEAGDANAGWIRRERMADKASKSPATYVMAVNAMHSAPTQFVTVAHELAHLLLGHLGPDVDLQAPDRHGLTHTQRELEAESVAYLVARRSGVDAKSERYLSGFVTGTTTVESLDVYQIMRAAGRVETLLDRTAHTSFGPRSS